MQEENYAIIYVQGSDNRIIRSSKLKRNYNRLRLGMCRRIAVVRMVIERHWVVILVHVLRWCIAQIVETSGDRKDVTGLGFEPRPVPY